MGHFVWLVALLICLLPNGISEANSTKLSKSLNRPIPHLLFISPAHSDDLFWQQVEQHMRYAATNFGFELKSQYANGSPLRVSALAKAAITSQDRPDFLLLQFNGPIMPILLASAQQHNVKVLTFNTAQSTDSRHSIGLPRERYTNWLAHLWPNDRLAGQLEAEALMQAARQQWPQETPTILAFNGAKSEVSRVATERSQGLHQAVAYVGSGRLAQEFSTYWDADKATRPLLSALKRYPDARLLWSASDAMGLRLRQQLLEGGRQIDAFLIASIDATPQGISAVERGELVATVGGHFMEGAWCMVLIYDYLHQHDFAKEGVLFQTDMQTFDRHSVAILRQLYTNDAFAKLDYHAFTQTDAPPGKANLAGYDFSWQRLLHVFQQQELLHVKP